METILQKWGNSNAIRIPKVILDDLGIKTNDVLVLEKVQFIEKWKNKILPKLWKFLNLV